MTTKDLQLPEGLPLDALLEATEISGALIIGEVEINVGQREKLLCRLERDYLPALLPHKNFAPARKVLETYNHNVGLSSYKSEHTYIKLD